MHCALGPIVRLFTRALYQDIESRSTWHDAIKLSQNSLKELHFWKDNLITRNGFTFKHHPTTAKIIFTDASDSGYGGFLCERLGSKICVGKFTFKEQGLSSTSRELLAVQNVLDCFGHFLEGQSVQINTDSQNTSRIISVGSSKEHLQNIAVQIFEKALKHDILIVPNWIPRDQNTIADHLSKFNDTDDWSIDNGSFNCINNKFGPFTVDRFADNKNKKVSKFNSKFFCPGSSSVNAFIVDWSSENNWLCPPISLIGSTNIELRNFVIG